MRCVCGVYGVCGRQRIIERCLALDKQRTRLAARPQSLVATVWVVSAALLPLPLSVSDSLLSVRLLACWHPNFLACCLSSHAATKDKQNGALCRPLAKLWGTLATPTSTPTATRTLAKRHTACKWKCKRASSPPSTVPLSYLPVASGCLPPPLDCPCTTSAADMIYALMSRFFDKVLNL